MSYFASCYHLSDRINDLEKQILERQHEMCAAEAKIVYEDLVSIHETLVEHENKYKTTSNAYTLTSPLATDMSKTHLKTTNLKIKLAKILSSFESKSSAEAQVGNQSYPAKQSETEKNVDLQIRKQRFLIKRIESLEIPDDICAIKAEVLYNHLYQLYDTFISNQIQIEAGTDDDTTLDNQQKITTEIQRKVIDFQTKLKKIMQPIASTLSTESNINIDRSIQPPPIDTSANLDSLFQKQESLIKRISLLEPKDDLSPEKAEAMYNHLDSLYESFNSNQTEIESRVSGPILASQLGISEQIQNKMIELRAKLKKIFAPIKVSSSSTQFETLSSLEKSESDLRAIELKLSELITSCEDLPELLSDGQDTMENINKISSSLNDHLSISKDIQTQMRNFMNADKKRTAILNNILTKVDKNIALQNPSQPPRTGNLSTSDPYSGWRVERVTNSKVKVLRPELPDFCAL